MSLPATFGVGPCEPPTSYLSRLAAFNGVTALELCRDFGIDFQGVVDGSEASLRALADLAGVPCAEVAEFAFVRRKGFEYEHRGEIFVRDMLRRRRILVCPECLREDIAANDDPDRDPATLVRNRADWCIGAVATCGWHRIALVEVADADDFTLRHDFVRLVGPALPRLDELSGCAMRRSPTGLEDYISARLAKRSDPVGFLDNLEIHVAITVCLFVGAMKIHGRTVEVDRLDEEESRVAAGTGFLTLRGGEAAFTKFLTDVHHEFSIIRKSGPYGPAVALGALYGLLKTRRLRIYPRDASFAPVRSFVAEFAASNFAMRSGEEFLGRRTVERRLHSVHSLSEQTGLNPARLKKVLHAFGVIDDRQMAYPPNQIVFDANAGAEVVRLERESMGLPDAAKRIGATFKEAMRLARDGFIKPVAMPTASRVRPRYDAAELDRFVDSITKCMKRATKGGEGLVSIEKASLKACRPTATVLRHVLAGDLKNVFRLTGKRGYGALLVDIVELRWLVHGTERSGLKVREAAVAICISSDVAQALIRQGHIRTTVVKNTVNGQELNVVMLSEVEAFRRQYITAWLLGRERGLHSTSVRQAMERAGIKPAFDPQKIGGWIYRREEVPASFD